MFSIGDVVFVNGIMDGVQFNNTEGVIRSILNLGVGRFDYGIEFSSENSYFHDLEGEIPLNTGYFISPHLVTSGKKPKSGFSAFIQNLEKD